MERSNMQEYVIGKKELLKWCRIPVERLADHPERKCDILIREKKEELYRFIGDRMADELAEHNQNGELTKWILPSGHLDQYRYFAKRVNEERIDCSRLHIFHMDDWLDWQFRPMDARKSFVSARGIMESGFYALIEDEFSIPEENRHWPDMKNLDAIDDLIREMGGIDTVQGGVGCRGMVAFDEPLRSRYYKVTLEEYEHSKTRPAVINEDTIVAYAQREFGGCYEAIPPMGITIGMESILTAKKGIFLVTTGEWKQTVVRVALFGEATTEFPVTVLANRIPEFLLCCDTETADHVISRGSDAGYLAY